MSNRNYLIEMRNMRYNRIIDLWICSGKQSLPHTAFPLSSAKLSVKPSHRDLVEARVHLLTE